MSRTVLLHVPGLDWKILQASIEANRMPNVAGMLETGVSGRLYQQYPLGEPIPAVTVATGAPPWAHGALAPVCVDGALAATRLADAGDLEVDPVWRIVAASRDVAAAAIGWPLTHGSPDETGLLVVSDRFARAAGRRAADWTLDPAAISDPSARAALAELRLHPTELDAETLSLFVLEIARIDRETDPRLGRIALSVARAVTTHAAADWAATVWDAGRAHRLIAVHLDLVDALSAEFLRYAPPRQPQVSEVDQTLYGGVAAAAYDFLDLLIGHYVSLVGEEGTLLLASSHGYLSGADRPPPPTGLEGGQGEWAPKLRGRFGALAMVGPGVKRDALVFGATGQDIAPTLLATLGLSPAEAMEGRVLFDAFETAPTPTDQPALQPRPAVDRPAQSAQSLAADNAYLRAAGQHPLPTDDPELAADMLAALRLRRLAASYAAVGRRREAIAQGEALLALRPADAKVMIFIAELALAEADHALAARMLGEAEATDTRGSLRERIAVVRASLAIGSADEHAAFAQAHEVVAAARAQQQLGMAALRAGRLEDAEALFRTLFEVDANDAAALRGLGLTLARLGRDAEALVSLRRSVGQLYWQPDVHFQIGLALVRLGDTAAAMEAFRVTLHISPDHTAARKTLERAVAATVGAAVRRVARLPEGGA